MTNVTVKDMSRAAVVFRALSDETRLAILHALRDGECCVCDLQGELNAAQSRLSFHLRVLKDAGILLDRTEGRWSYYRIASEALTELHQLAVAFQPRKRSLRTLPPGCCG
jgi:ArsR family transcriptional regulator